MGRMRDERSRAYGLVLQGIYIRAQGSGFRVVRIFQVSKISAIHGWHGTVWLEFLVWRKSGNREVERGEGLQIRCEVHHLEFKASGAQETALVLGFKLQDMPSDLKKHTNYEQQASIPNRKHQLQPHLPNIQNI